jgi:carboxypeptidase Q
MNRRMCLAVAVVVVAANAHAQTATTTAAPAIVQRAVGVPSNDELVARMIQEGTQRSHVDADLQYLLDVIGPRLTGSAEMRRANDWTRQKFLEYGADRADLESWSFGIGWTRGPMTLRLLAPQRRELLGVSWAWSPGTKGPVAGDVVLLDARTQADFDRRFAGKLRGAWVMLGPAFPVMSASAPPLTRADTARLDSLARATGPRSNDEAQFFNSRLPLLAREGAAGAIHDGGKQFGLLTMSGSPAYISPIPQIVVGNDTYSQFERLARRGERARLEVDISNTFSRDTLSQWNTVPEIRGS